MQKLVVLQRAAVQIIHTLLPLLAGLFIISCSTRESVVRENPAGYSRSGSGSLGVAVAQPEADLRHVKIIRAGRNEDPVEVDLATALENGTVEGLPRVRPGDTVFVPKTENAVKQFSDFLRDAVLLFGFFSFVH